MNKSWAVQNFTDINLFESYISLKRAFLALENPWNSEDSQEMKKLFNKITKNWTPSKSDERTWQKLISKTAKKPSYKKVW